MVNSKIVATGLSKITESSIENNKKVPVIEGLRSSSQVLKEESILSPKQRKRLNDNGEYDSASGSKSNSGSGSDSESEEDDYVDIEVFAKYKAEIEKRLQYHEVQLYELKQTNDTVLAENMMLLKKVSEIDFNVMAHAEILVTDTIQEF